SLRPGATQPTCAVHMRFSVAGDLENTRIAAGRLEHAWAVSYADAAEILRDAEHPMRPQLATAHSLAAILLARRQRAGALAFYDLFKGYATNEEGHLVRLGDNQRNAGYVIVQELMIAANAAAATWCASRDLPILFRNHRAAAVGGSREDLLSELETAEARGDAVGYELLRKRMGVVQRPATYEPSVFGHYGLSLPMYAHNTSPLRRYPDLVNQRIMLAAAEGAESPYTYDELAEIGADLNARMQRDRERRAEGHKAAARKAVREQLAEAEYATLETPEFGKVLRLALSRPAPPAGLVAEAERRIDDESLPLRDSCEILTAGRDPRWSSLRTRIYRGLAAEPSRALTVVSMYAQSVVGGPVNDSHVRWRFSSVGTIRKPCFEAELRLELGETVHVSPARAQLSKKDAKAQAALAMLAQVAELPDLSHSVEAPEPEEDPATAQPVPSGRNPVMAVHEYAQAGVVSRLSWSFGQSGPSHEPVFECVADAVFADDGATLRAHGAGPGKQAAKTAAAEALRAQIESRIAEAPADADDSETAAT
ncbi:MAG: RNB domain-containing ribonuclease, partial [Stackebrandtia sp.]